MNLNEFGWNKYVSQFQWFILFIILIIMDILMNVHPLCELLCSQTECGNSA